MNRLHVRVFLAGCPRRPGLVAGQFGDVWLLSATLGRFVIVVLRGQRAQAGGNR